MHFCNLSLQKVPHAEALSPTETFRRARRTRTNLAVCTSVLLPQSLDLCSGQHNEPKPWLKLRSQQQDVGDEQTRCRPSSEAVVRYDTKLYLRVAVWCVLRGNHISAYATDQRPWSWTHCVEHNFLFFEQKICVFLREDLTKVPGSLDLEPQTDTLVDFFYERLFVQKAMQTTVLRCHEPRVVSGGSLLQTRTRCPVFSEQIRAALLGLNSDCIPLSDQGTWATRWRVSNICVRVTKGIWNLIKLTSCGLLDDKPVEISRITEA